jgi:hypothetical protein
MATDYRPVYAKTSSAVSTNAAKLFNIRASDGTAHGAQRIGDEVPAA